MTVVTDELVDSGLEYRPGERVLVKVRSRDQRTRIGDDGRAVELAGRPPGWRAAVERMIERDYWLNLSRQGAVFVPVTRDDLLEPLVRRVAEASLAVYQELLDLE